MPNLPDILKARRSELGLTLLQIAEATGVKEATVQRWESGNIKSLRHENLEKLAKALNMTPAALMGWNDERANAIVVDHPEPYKAPIVGTIPAGYPAVALEDIEGYEPIPYSNAEDYIFLRVSGDSMINADIRPDDLVLIRRQTTAEPGQIVACIVNGDEATLKRYRPALDGVYLMPENSAYAPRRVDYEDFENGYANIIGVAIEVRHKL